MGVDLMDELLSNGVSIKVNDGLMLEGHQRVRQKYFD